jgi:hypothetical protein
MDDVFWKTVVVLAAFMAWVWSMAYALGLV